MQIVSSIGVKPNVQSDVIVADIVQTVCALKSVMAWHVSFIRMMNFLENINREGTVYKIDWIIPGESIPPPCRVMQIEKGE